MRGRVAGRYAELARAGNLARDEAQLALVAELDRICAELQDRGRKSKKSSLGWLFAGSQPVLPVRGLYIWGGVGRGKTFLMDVFFEVAPVSAKRRVHFHEFMGEVQERLNLARADILAGELREDDPIAPVAAQLAEEASLLCFDEFAVHDIADAMILGRLFQQLFDRGVTVVATSNVPPERLYENGLNRSLFLPFIEAIAIHMPAFHLAPGHDYRLNGHLTETLYASPLGPAADRCLAAQFRRLTGRERGEPALLPIRGRQITVPEAAHGVARFTFAELCGAPLGAADYLKLAERFHTLVLAGIPILDAATRNEARRFINLIDTLYDHRIRLVVSAAAEPDELWTGTSGSEDTEFARTVSRLMEMRSQAYWDEAGPASLKQATRSA